MMMVTMLYTRAGDKGQTKLFGCNQKLSKNSAIAEALGSLDEINSLLGVCKVIAFEEKFSFNEQKPVGEILETIQQNLFIIQAELAGAPKTIEEAKVKEVEVIIDTIEKELPPIKTFFVSGGTKMASMLDFARTVSRRAERRVVGAVEEGGAKVGDHSRAYLNRLSSTLYALARLANHKSGITEKSPSY